MTKLSVNINKIATLRNARGSNNPDILQTAKDIENFGADGITVHPRPDERHITKTDVYDLNKIITKEFNIEGYPDQRYIQIIEDIRPTQATLVPDKPEQLTSNHGWDTINEGEELKKIIDRLKKICRVSVFVDANCDIIKAAKDCGADRVELYTQPYAENYDKDPKNSIKPFIIAGEYAKKLGLGLNAGHDLSLNNLKYFASALPLLDEVSIGHALICDALKFGMKNTISMYLRCLK